MRTPYTTEREFRSVAGSLSDFDLREVTGGWAIAATGTDAEGRTWPEWAAGSPWDPLTAEQAVREWFLLTGGQRLPRGLELQQEVT